MNHRPVIVVQWVTVGNVPETQAARDVCTVVNTLQWTVVNTLQYIHTLLPGSLVHSPFVCQPRGIGGQGSVQWVHHSTLTHYP